MEFLASIKGSIVWLGGALAALTALCYGAGYFAYHAHLTMLGLNGTIAFPHDQMLLEGSQFLLGTVSALLMDAFYGFIVLMVATLFWLAVRRVLSNLTAFAGARRSVARRWSGLRAAHPHLLLAFVLLGLGLLLGWHYGTFFETMKALESDVHLLFAQTAPYGCDGLDDAAPSAVSRIAAGLIVRGETCRASLQGEFTWLVQGYFVLLVIVALVMSKSANWLPSRLRTVVKSSVGLYAGIYTLWLPVAYGVLVRAPIYPQAEVALARGGSDHGWLLSRSGDGLLLWRDDARSAIWYPPNQTGQVRVTQVGNIFGQRVAQ